MIARALAEPRRYEILRLIRSHGGECSCGVIFDALPIGAATLSHHMKELEAAGLVTSQRTGRTMRYVLRDEVLAQFLEQLRTTLL